VTGATARLSRLLALVPYLLARQGVPIGDAAREFGISERQLVKDLELLFVCGLPGHLPDDLIEADWESGHVYVSNADAIARPLRLGVDEAVALLVGLRTLAELPGLHDRDALERAIAKLERAAGDAAAPGGQVAVEVDGHGRGAILALWHQALALGRRLHLRYHVPARDETTERDVDPMRVVVVDGRPYLEAWCRRAEGVRLFRLDRVVDATLLDIPAAVPEDARPRDFDEGVFQPSPDDLLVTVDLRPAGHWVAEYYPCESIEELEDEALRITLRTADTRWVERLLLRLGGSGQVVEPADLAERVRNKAVAALAAYDAA
jgi:predicted DNA-binding transcriptional regulator YafY